MFEKKLYQEIPGGKNKFHSAILTSFSFNFHHFEYQVLRTLRQKWISSVVVLTDQNMLDRVLGVASGNLKQLSQSYSVIGIESHGAFHPKINLLIGDEQLLVFFGSGNITPGGHGKNHELFSGFYVDKHDKKQLPLILEAWNYIKNIADSIDGYSRDLLLKVIPGTCNMLNAPLIDKHIYRLLEDSIEVAFLYNDETTIFEQFATLIPKKDISTITVISPYYDEDGRTLLNLKGHFANANIDVFLPSDFGLPPIKMIQNESISFFSWEETERGKKSISGPDYYRRKLHSKIFHFESDEFEYCLIGSANATIPGLGSLSKRSSNEEFCALYKTSKRGILESIGISGTKQRVAVEDLTREPVIAPVTGEVFNRKTVRITSADLNGSRLKVFYKLKHSHGNYDLSIYNGAGIRIFKETVNLSDLTSVSVQLTNDILKLNPGYVLFENEKGRNPLSNKQIINFIDKLLNTDPSKGNRNIRQVLNALEGGTINEFEIIEFINNIYRSSTDNGHSQKIGLGSRINQGESNDVFDSEMTYEDAVIAAKNSSNTDSIFRGHSSIRLWETISRLFHEKKNTVDEELMDEEEEGSAEKSRDRNTADIESAPIIVKDSDQFKKIFNSATRLSDNYIQSLTKICYMPDHKVNELDLGNFLLVTHVLTAVCNFREYKFEELKDPSKCEDKLKKFYINSMLDILVNFTKLIFKKNLENYPDNDYQNLKLDEYLQKAIYHFWMYLHLIQRRSTEPVVIDKVDLLGLNFLHCLGKPDQGFEIYIKNISATFGDIYFNPMAVTTLYEKLLDIFHNLNDHYIAIDHSGICQILSNKNRQIEYNSLFAHDHISHAKLKKHRIEISRL